MRGSNNELERRRPFVPRLASTLGVESTCQDMSPCTAAPSPVLCGVIAPRRIVRSLNPPPFLTQLVQLDESATHPPVLEFASGTVCSEETIKDDVSGDTDCAGGLPLHSSTTPRAQGVSATLREATVNSCSVTCPVNGAGSPVSSCPRSSLQSTPHTELFDMESVCSCSLSECGDSRHGALGASRDALGLSLATLDRVSLVPVSPRASAATGTVPQRQRRKILNVQREERLGRGGSGDVYRVVDLDTGMPLAMKEILVAADSFKAMEKQLRAMEREIHVMRKLHHEHIINYFSAQRGTEHSSLLIFMEYVGGGTIARRLRMRGAFREDEARHYTRQLLGGLDYLHQCHVVHRDLKGENLFLTEDNTLKVGDFGTSKELQTTRVTDSVAGTPNFMAPEVIACSGHSYMADIWSVGCCVLEMLAGHPPFSTLDNHMAVMFAVMKGRVEEEVPAGLSDAARDFIRRCTRHDPQERPTARQLREHAWLASFAAQPPSPCGSSGGGQTRRPALVTRADAAQGRETEC